MYEETNLLKIFLKREDVVRSNEKRSDENVDNGGWI